ncbi:hypothetical protein [Rubrivivax gelatinosus]|uniref:hypothetical protein n=1 Tax=Rubrivivax gelatinosus TaxID=28068 RepID=UPI0019040D51|nr:hypothetical protein [Rubrivivax gelatinosus]
MKPALTARAAARGVSASVVVREALAAAGVGEAPDGQAADSTPSPAGRVRVGMRLAVAEARELSARAAAAGLPVGAYVVAAMRAGGDVPSADQRAACIAALTRSNAEMAVMSRNIAHLAALLRHGTVDAAKQYRESLDMLNKDVRTHLALSAEVLAERRPQTLPTISRRSRYG